MEKRILLAFLLSWIILVTYQTLLPKKATNVLLDSIDNSQHIENKYVKKNITNPRFVDKDSEKTPKNYQKFIEKSDLLENGQLLVELSNLGGNVKNIILKKYEYRFPLSNMFDISGYEASEFKPQFKSGDSIVYMQQNETFKILKKYSFSPESDLLNVELSVKNISLQAQSVNLKIINFSVDGALLTENQGDHPELALLEYSISQNGQIKRKDNAYKFSTKENWMSTGKVDWVGYRTRYYCLIMRPNFITRSAAVLYNDNQKITISSDPESLQLNASAEINLSFTLYAGPQNIEKLSSYGSGFEKIVSYSRFGILDFVSKSSAKLLNFIHRIIPNWGISILILGVLVYSVMYPLTMAGMVSMKKMQALQPKMVQLREQHKNNHQRLNKEMMELYREHRVNPFGGCLPFILQMPVFIGLYQALWRSVSFKGAKFFWIKDLSEPDRLFIFPFNLPLVGNEFNILPIIMIGIMVLQQKLSLKNMLTSDKNQIMQQKIMTTVFPVFIGFIFYKFSSGLTLYFTVFYILSTFTQWKMSKMIIPVLVSK